MILPKRPNPINSVAILQAVQHYKNIQVKGRERLAALKLAISMIDLTTLEGSDTTSKVKQLCHQARFALPAALLGEPPVGYTAAVCVYPRLVAVADNYLKSLEKLDVDGVADGRKVRIAAVATYFPSGQLSEKNRLVDVEEALAAGADEIDIVINRGAFLEGDFETVYDEVKKAKEICGDKTLKVILETGELRTLENVRFASDIAIAAGADFIKTSTGKISPGATMPVSLVMLQAIRHHFLTTGKMVGMKPAGGIRNGADAIAYLNMVDQVLGEAWLTPTYFRFGASSLLGNLVKEINKLSIS